MKLLIEVADTCGEVADWLAGDEPYNPEVLIGALTAAESKLRQAAGSLYYVLHHHKHGVSVFIVRSDRVPSERQVIEACEIDYEPVAGESLDIEHIGPGDDVREIGCTGGYRH